MHNEHALLSASGAKRWLSCPPSVRLEEEFEEKPSTYAIEGTYAHSVAELKLRYSFDEINAEDYDRQKVKLQEQYPEYHNEELADYIEWYVNTVLEIFAEAKTRCSDAIIMLEQRVDFSEYVPGGFGTSDVVIIADQMLQVIDLKYGRGVKVDAEDNPQLKLYALGAYKEFEMLYNITQVKMTIIQPRLDHVVSSELVVEDLLEWAENEIRTKAELAFKGEGEFSAGSHCHFCKAKQICKARADKNLELLKYEFKSPHLLEDDEIGPLLLKVGELIEWAKSITDYVYEQSTQYGKKYAGWKLVQGRSNRKYKDTIAVAKTLTDAGYDEALIYEKNLLGITAMEKLVGKKQFNELLKDLVVKPEGRPILVVESDNRPEFKPVQAIKDAF